VQSVSAKQKVSAIEQRPHTTWDQRSLPPPPPHPLNSAQLGQGCSKLSHLQPTPLPATLLQTRTYSQHLTCATTPTRNPPQPWHRPPPARDGTAADPEPATLPPALAERFQFRTKTTTDFFPPRGLSSLHNPHRASASPAPRQGAPGSAVTAPQTAMGRQHGHAGSPSSAGCESCEGNSASSLLSHLEGTRLLALLHAPSRSAVTGSQPGPGTVTGHRAPPRAPPPRRALPHSVRACKRRRRLAVCRMA